MLFMLFKLFHTAELFAPGICPAFTVKSRVGNVVLLSVISEAVAPDYRGQSDNNPVKRA